MSNLQLSETKTFSLVPTSFHELEKYARLIADSELAPKDYKGKPGNVMVAIQLGFEIGLKPMQAIQNIAVINGRPCIWGDAMLAIVKSHPDFEDIQEYEEPDGTAVCIIKRRGQSPVQRRFSNADAKGAGLLGKPGPWTQYQSRMKQMRARGFACRDAFPDAIKGLNLAEEVQDYQKEKDVTPPSRAANALKDLGIAKQSEPDSIEHQEAVQEPVEMPTEEQSELVDRILKTMMIAETVEELDDYLKAAAIPLTGNYRKTVVTAYKAKKKKLQEAKPVTELDASWEEFKHEEQA